MDAVDRIFALLDKMPIEQQEFAKRVGVSDDTASNWRRRKSASYTKYLSEIADTLGTTVEYLLAGKKEATSVQSNKFSDFSTPIERIFSLLKVKEIEQKEFAQLLGTTDKTVSAWKTGRSQSYTKYLPKISEVLGTTVEYLLTGEKTEPTVQDDKLPEWFYAMQSLSPKAQDEVIAFIEFKRGQEAK